MEASLIEKHRPSPCNASRTSLLCACSTIRKAWKASKSVLELEEQDSILCALLVVVVLYYTNIDRNCALVNDKLQLPVVETSDEQPAVSGLEKQHPPDIQMGLNRILAAK